MDHKLIHRTQWQEADLLHYKGKAIMWPIITLEILNLIEREMPVS